ncbi:MAG: phosphate acetyltransferase [Spirochaetaceae bacterium 4572_59]|nr:MAG: phosphate acetyltransferase [Spirochaetaceae bacterium 4572_59]
MSFVKDMKAQAIKMQKKLVLPEGSEPRTLQAARIIVDEKVVSEVFLIGAKAEIEAAATSAGVKLDGITIVDPATSELAEAYGKEYYELRKHKGLSEEDAASQIKDCLKWGAMMVRKGDADAMVAGADNPTGKVLVAGFTIVKTAAGVSSASSCFVMDFPEKKWGHDGMMIFSDCATIPDPTVEQLAEITIQSSASCKTFLQTEPVTAMLSFSTKGSAAHPNVDKVTEAFKLVQERAPELNVDGELQLDAAIVESVGAKKAPGSKVAGKANTLIFPDLQSGNIGYKLAQRFGNAGAYGPFLQGFAKPISDLSRGCSVEDIVNTISVTMTQVED